MPIFSLVYVSKACVSAAEAEAAIDAIVTVSQRRNVQDAITGVLIYAEDRFAQLLEGGEAEVRSLMARIAADRRHADVRVVSEERRRARRVPDWNLAYAGPSSFVAGHIAPLITGGDRGMLHRASRRLIELMVEFSLENVSRSTRY